MFFEKKFGYTSSETLDFASIELKRRLDFEVKASGFLNTELKGKIEDLELLEDLSDVEKPENEEGEE